MMPHEARRKNVTDEVDGIKSMCPITAEAWLVLSAFIANQIKFGYELEKLLINEMSKLGIDTLPCQVGDADVETDGTAEPHSHNHTNHRSTASSSRFSHEQQSQLV